MEAPSPFSAFRDTVAGTVHNADMDDETKNALEGMGTRILERIEATETKLLSAFHGWARPIETRMRSLPAIDERLGYMEERISAVERKLLERGI
jgi:hypothetical protein